MQSITKNGKAKYKLKLREMGFCSPPLNTLCLAGYKTYPPLIHFLAFLVQPQLYLLSQAVALPGLGLGDLLASPRAGSHYPPALQRSQGHTRLVTCFLPGGGLEVPVNPFFSQPLHLDNSLPLSVSGSFWKDITR